MPRITRENARFDKVGSPWLIEKFAYSYADFGLSSHDSGCAGVHEETVNDIPGCDPGHSGEGASFEAILRKYRLIAWALDLSNHEILDHESIVSKSPNVECYERAMA